MSVLPQLGTYMTSCRLQYGRGSYTVTSAMTLTFAIMIVLTQLQPKIKIKWLKVILMFSWAQTDKHEDNTVKNKLEISLLTMWCTEVDAGQKNNALDCSIHLCLKMVKREQQLIWRLDLVLSTKLGRKALRTRTRLWSTLTDLHTFIPQRVNSGEYKHTPTSKGSSGATFQWDTSCFPKN